MINKYILPLIVSLVLMTFLASCGHNGNNPHTGPVIVDNRGSNPFGWPNVFETWNGIWTSSKVNSSGTFSLTLTQSSVTVTQPADLSGSVTMNGSPCFSTSPVTGWSVSGNTVIWSSPGIGDFSGTISGNTISGIYSVTSAGACFGDTGVFSITS